jgi:manganese oxidase
VAPRAGDSYLRAGAPRQLDLYMNQGGPRGNMKETFSYILQNGATPPAKDSILVPGSLLLLTRGEPVDVTVHNRTKQPGGIHWHGIELESWSDGVMGWSSRGSEVAPAIEPGKSFTAHLALPRAGTFMYHTHMNDIEQVTNGAVGPIVVLEPGEKFDPSRDHVYITLWHGPTSTFLVNGDSTESPPLEVTGGVTQRFRFINIGPAGRIRFTLKSDTTTVEWRARAKDGADLSMNQRTLRPATFRLDVGETYDFEFTPPTIPGRYELSAAFNAVGAPISWRQQLVVK